MNQTSVLPTTNKNPAKLLLRLSIQAFRPDFNVIQTIKSLAVLLNKLSTTKKRMV